MSDLAVVVAAVAAVAGALAGERLGPSPGGWCLAAALFAALAAMALRPATGRRRAVAALALALVAAALMQRSLAGLDGPMARLAAAEPELVARVRLAEDPRGTRFRVAVLARLSAPDEAGGKLVAVVARPPAAGRLRLLAAGETAVLQGRLRPLAGAERRLRWRHAAAALDAGDLLAAGPAASPAWRLANGLRHLVLSGTETMPAPAGALTAGLLVGDDRHLPPEMAADFRAAGLSHLLAVSGANVALVLVLAGPVLRCFGLAGRTAGGVAVITVFAAMARFEPSVLRAVAMSGTGLLAVALGRPASGGRLLAVGTAGLVLADPFLVHSLGFQLSVAATAGILALARPLADRLPGPAPVRAALAVTGAAQAGVAPVALPAFGSLPLVALPANLLAAPAAAALTLWAFGAGLAGGLLEPWLPTAAAPLAVPGQWLAGYLAGVAALAARAPMPVPAEAVLLGGAVLSWRWLYRRARFGPPPSPAGPLRSRADCPAPGPRAPSAPGRWPRRR